VEREGAFGGVNPLEGGVALGISEGWEEAVGGIVGVAEVSLKSDRLAYISQRLDGCFGRLTLRYCRFR